MILEEENNKTITVCITSFNRFDLLKQAIDSLLKLNTYHIDRVAIIEDSTNIDIKNKIINTYGDKIDLIFNENNLGQPASIDKIYHTVKTKYIFHTEDDYLYVSNPNFIKDAIDILEERPAINQVWVRNLDDFLRRGNNDTMRQFEEHMHQTSTLVHYRMLKANHGGWCGFSFMPAVKRTEDYHRIFPNGYSGCVQSGHFGARAEGEINDHARVNEYRGAILVNGACNDNGFKASTYRGKPITGSFKGD